MYNSRWVILFFKVFNLQNNTKIEMKKFKNQNNQRIWIKFLPNFILVIQMNRIILSANLENGYRFSRNKLQIFFHKLYQFNKILIEVYLKLSNMFLLTLIAP